MLEGVLVGLIVAFAALHVARRILPRRWFGVLGTTTPKVGCGTGCGTCGGCASGGTTPKSASKPLIRG